MNPHENNGEPPAGGFGAPGSAQGPLPGPIWVPSPVPEGSPGAKMARASLWLGIIALPGIFLCNMLGLPLAVAAVSLGIAALYRAKGHPYAPDRRQAIGGLVCGCMAIFGIAALFAFFALAR